MYDDVNALYRSLSVEKERKAALDRLAALVADAFVKCLREDLTPEEFKEMQRRNAAETDRQVCHSHDFCDANMTMDRAMGEVGLDTSKNDESRFPVDAQRICDVWNEAWAIAAAGPLRLKRVKPLRRAKARTVLDVYHATVGAVLTESYVDDLKGVPADTPCGRDCVAAIEAMAAYLKIADDGDSVVLPAKESLEDCLITFILG